MNETAHVLRIVEAISRLTGIRTKDILGNSRVGQVARARFTAQYLARTQTSLSFPAIGAIFGARNHATIISACNKETLLLQRGALFAGRIPMQDWHLKVLAEVEALVKIETDALVAAAGVAVVAEVKMPQLKLVQTQVLKSSFFDEASPLEEPSDA
jgi:hypothetical protein